MAQRVSTVRRHPWGKYRGLNGFKHVCGQAVALLMCDWCRTNMQGAALLCDGSQEQSISKRATRWLMKSKMCTCLFVLVSHT